MADFLNTGYSWRCWPTCAFPFDFVGFHSPSLGKCLLLLFNRVRWLVRPWIRQCLPGRRRSSPRHSTRRRRRPQHTPTPHRHVLRVRRQQLRRLGRQHVDVCWCRASTTSTLNGGGCHFFFMEVEAKGTLRSAGRTWPKEIGLAAFTHPRNT
jgi:hypothetical protein